MATFMERLAFLQKVPTLMKATADDESPCPGYLFQEIGKISHESLASDQCLLEYLLDRLQVESCHVKLKVLKIFVHLSGHGSKHFLTELRRNSTFIQQASVYSGPPDPIHGTALYQKVRNTAQEVARLLFTDTIYVKSGALPFNVVPSTMGMGSAASHRVGMQGFGYNPGKQGTGNVSLLNKIQKAAEVVASAVLPPTEHQGIRLHDNHYRPVVAPSVPIEVAVPACAYSLPARRLKGVTQRCPGQVGGGWEETDSGNTSSHNSSQDISTNSRASAGSKCTGSQSGASRESSGDLSERVEALQLGDCVQEMALISKLTEGSRVFLTNEESQHFIKECSTLNCEVVVELLLSRLQDPANTVNMRALCAVACLMTADLLSLEQIFGATQRRLCQLSEGPPGPVTNKATKVQEPVRGFKCLKWIKLEEIILFPPPLICFYQILRQFKALMGGVHHAAKQDPASSSYQVNHISSQVLTSTFSGSLEPTFSPHNDRVCQPSSPFSVDNSCEKPPLTEQQLFLAPVRTHLTLATKDEECTQPCVSRLSLFSGMMLVNRARPLCETTRLDPNSRQDPLKKNQPYSPVSVVSDSSQQSSAFSFLNS
ncbi:AP-4 complex accessory subunit tepsin isoform X2 [Phyllopteryx taeniolatus]|uniref:AP-4 complex accessory subunit tepsin isoform X2 n=1 Tax=Phyllopteryx taeniolatus TaxID=161469 RepID=UPI002AD4AAFF|nr:AP-4 complex accessory subunit tepsin isoform X2 [Phyllopteryx taeniolatus]